MIIPVRCFTCGKVIANMSKRFDELKEAGMPIPHIYQELGIKRICCKRMLFTCVNAADVMAQYTILPDKVERTEFVDKQRTYRTSGGAGIQQ